jgi:hypothetical protein
MIVYRPLKAIRLKCLDCSELRKDVTECPCNGVESPLCNLHPYRFGKRPRSQSQQAVLEGPAISKTVTVSQSQTGPDPKSIKNPTPHRAIRKHCLDCADGNAKYVLWCPRDGTHKRNLTPPFTYFTHSVTQFAHSVTQFNHVLAHFAHLSPRNHTLSLNHMAVHVYGNQSQTASRQLAHFNM